MKDGQYNEEAKDKSKRWVKLVVRKSDESKDEFRENEWSVSATERRTNLKAIDIVRLSEPQHELFKVGV